MNTAQHFNKFKGPLLEATADPDMSTVFFNFLRSFVSDYCEDDYLIDTNPLSDLDGVTPAAILHVGTGLYAAMHDGKVHKVTRRDRVGRRSDTWNGDDEYFHTVVSTLHLVETMDAETCTISILDISTVTAEQMEAVAIELDNLLTELP